MAVAYEQPIALVLADPHPVMLDGLRKDLQEWPEFQIHACAKDGESALRAIHEHKPDYIVLDLPLAKRSGLALIQELQLQKFKTQHRRNIMRKVGLHKVADLTRYAIRNQMVAV